MQKYNENLIETQKSIHETLRREFLYRLEHYLEGLLSKLELAQTFEEKSGLASGDLIVTSIRLYEGNLAVSLPVGKQHGVATSLSLEYNLYRVAENIDFPDFLGTAILKVVDDKQSLALVHPADLQIKFWKSVQDILIHSESYDINLQAKPAIHPLFEGSDANTLSVARQLLKQMIQDTVRSIL